MKLILASTSKFRAEVLRDAGYVFEAVAPEVDEKAIRDKDPFRLVEKLAQAKAEAVVKKINGRNAIVIGSDQVVMCNGEMREKPIDQKQAREFLASYAHHPLELLNAIHVINTTTGAAAHAMSKTTVTFHPSIASITEEVLKKGIIMHCAGAIQIEDALVAKHIASTNGAEDSYKGLPLHSLKSLLENTKGLTAKKRP